MRYSLAAPISLLVLTTLIGSAVLPLLPVPIFAQTTYTISGFVYLDSNNNGERDEEEVGVVDVEIALFADSVFESTTSAADGFYSFPDINNAGAVDVFLNELVDGHFISEPVCELSHSFELDGDATDINFGLASLADFGGAIAGTVYNDSDANGEQDGDETGIEGILVTLVDPTRVIETQSDEQGNYSFASVAPCDVEVSIQLPSDSNIFVEPSSGSHSFALASNEELAGLDFGVTEGASIAGTVYLDANANGIRDEEEDGIEDVEVTVTSADPEDALFALAITGSDGSYLLNGLPSGLVDVEIDVPDGNFVTQPFETDGTYSLALELAQSEEGKDFGLAPLEDWSASVSGTAFLDLNVNAQHDDDEPVVSGKTIFLFDYNGQHTAETDDSGQYTIADIVPGLISVFVDDVGRFASPPDMAFFADIQGANMVPPTDSEAMRDFGDYYYDKNARYLHFAIVGDMLEGNEISGHIHLGGVDENGPVIFDLPIGRSIIGVAGPFSEEQEQALLDEQLYIDFHSDLFPDGEIRGQLQHQTTNTYHLVIMPGEERVGVDFGEGFPPNPGSIAGTVFNDLNGDGIQDAEEQGISDVEVYAQDSYGLQIALTDENGHYLLTDLAPGTVYVNEFTPGGFFKTQPLSFSADIFDASEENGHAVGTGILYYDSTSSLLHFSMDIDDTDASFSEFVIRDNVEGGNVTDPETDPVLFTIGELQFDDSHQTSFAEGSLELIDSELESLLLGGWYIEARGEFIAQGQFVGFIESAMDAGFAYFLHLGENESLDGFDFGNAAILSSTTFNIHVFNDTDKDGLQDEGEPGLAGWQFSIKDGNDVLLVDDDTDGSGTASLIIDDISSNPPPYLVEQVVQEGWSSTNAASRTIPIALLEQVNEISFGNVMTGSISGFVYQDNNNDGNRDEGEPGLEGTTITLTREGDYFDFMESVTDSEGQYSFSDLFPGTYLLGGFNSLGIGTEPGSSFYTVTVNGGEQVDADPFGFFIPATLVITLDDGSDDGINARVSLTNEDTGKLLAVKDVQLESSVTFTMLTAVHDIIVEVTPLQFGTFQQTSEVLQLQPGENIETIELQPEPTGFLTGRAFLPDDTPVPSVLISAFPNDAGDLSQLYTILSANDGTYELELPPGSYTIRSQMETGDHRMFLEEIVSIDEGQTTTIDLPFEFYPIGHVTANVFTKFVDSEEIGPIPMDFALRWAFGMFVEESGFFYPTRWNEYPISVPGSPGDQIKACIHPSLFNPSAFAGSPLICQDAILGEDGNAEIDFHITETARITGTVIDPTPEEDDVWLATLISIQDGLETGWTSLWLYPDDGVLEMGIGILEPGSYQLLVRNGVSERASVSFSVSEGEILNLGDIILQNNNIAFTNTKLNFIRSSIDDAIPGDRVTLHAEFKNLGDSATLDSQLVFNIPTQVQLVDGSVQLNGTPVVPSVITDSLFSIPLGTIERDGSGILTYQVDISDIFSADGATFHASIHYSSSDDSHEETIGSTSLNVQQLTMTVPSTISTLDILASGRAPAGSTVTIFDGGSPIATLLTSPGGHWKGPLTLPDTGEAFHTLQARVIIGSETIQSPEVFTRYDPSLPAPEEFCVNQAGFKRVCVDPSNGMQRFPFAGIMSSPITYETRFDNPDAVTAVKFVITHNGIESHIDATLGDDGIHRAIISPSEAGPTYIEFRKVLYPGNNGVISAAMIIPDEVIKTAIIDTLPEFNENSLVIDNIENIDFFTEPSARTLVPHSLLKPDMSYDINYEFNGFQITDHYTITPNTSCVPSGQEDMDLSAELGVDVYQSSINTEDPFSIVVSFCAPYRIIGDPAVVLALDDPPAEDGVGVIIVKTAGEHEIDTVKGALLGTLGTPGAIYGHGEGAYNYGSQMLELERLKAQCGSDPSCINRINREQRVGTGGYLTDISKNFIPSNYGPALWVADLFSKINTALFNKATDELKKVNRDMDRDSGSGCSGIFCSPGGSPLIKIDPSGYVYEAVTSNRLEDVRATVLLQDSITDQFEVWDGTDYEEVNPQFTDAMGRYEWDVPPGFWQVMYEKDGYLQQFSDVLEIPPPRTDVNIGLVSVSPPMVTAVSAIASESDSSITLTFDKYIKVDSVVDGSFFVSGIDGSIEPLGVINEGIALTRTFRLVPDSPLVAGNQYSVHVSHIIESYAGIAMAEDYAASVIAIAPPSYALSLVDSDGASVDDVLVGQSVIAEVETNDPLSSEGVLHWYSPENELIKTEIISLSPDDQAQSEPFIAPIDGSWHVEIEFTNGNDVLEIISTAFSVSNDETPPSIDIPNDIETVTNSQGAEVSFSISATDNLDDNPDLGCTPPTGFFFPLGESTVTCLASDSAGNVGTASFKVRVFGSISSGSDVETPSFTIPGGQVKLKFADVQSGGSISVSQTTASSLADDIPSIFTEVGSDSSKLTIGSGIAGTVGNPIEIRLGSGIVLGLGSTIDVTIPYDPNLLPAGMSESDVRFLHWTGTLWEDVTLSVDVINNTVTGRLSSLSPVVAAIILSSQPDQESSDRSLSSGGGGNRVVVVYNEQVMTLSESHFIVNPLDKIKISNSAFLNPAGATISQGSIGQQISIAGTFGNYQQSQQDYAFIVMVVDGNGYAVDINWQQGTLASGATTQVLTSWTPQTEGGFIVKIFMWDGVGTAPTPLSTVTVKNIDVS